MQFDKAPRRAIALLLGVLLASCHATRYTGPTRPEELVRLVLVIRELPNGQVTHSWQPAEELDTVRYRHSSSTYGLAGRIVRASGTQRDCHAEYLQCHRACKRSRLPPGYEHIPQGGARHDSLCWDKCKQPYLDCEKLRDLQPRVFTAVDGAIDWLKNNHKALWVGSIVAIAGVAFVVVSAGAGLVILAPAALVTSPVLPAEPHLAATSR